MVPVGKSARLLAARAVTAVLVRSETLEAAVHAVLVGPAVAAIPAAAITPAAPLTPAAPVTPAVPVTPAAPVTRAGATEPSHPPGSLRSAVRSLAYGAVRGFHRHQALLRPLLTQPVGALEPSLRALFSVALFELEDARTPEYAIVDAAVETARALGEPRAAGLVNAVLRRFLRERRLLEADIVRQPATRHAFPEWLAGRVRADWPGRWLEILGACDAQAPLWLRVNVRRSDTAAELARLRSQGIAARAEPRVPGAIVLESARDVAELAGFEAGAVSVQDLGAQCVAFALDLAPGQRVLDACAAPGGKTALIAERQPALARLTALDIDALRLERVRENLTRCGLQAQLLVGDLTTPDRWWDGECYDRILLDAPCSALGVIRRHPDIRLRRSAADLDRLPRLQARLLRAAWRMLAPGGRLVYATCTFTQAENRERVTAFLEATPDARCEPPAAWPGRPDFGSADDTGWQILPGEAGADGFYYAALCKR
jgi:16S rRNA (cytosine967-C5)-methyltransferase